jgi:hypothetical protein
MTCSSLENYLVFNKIKKIVSEMVTLAVPVDINEQAKVSVGERLFFKFEGVDSFSFALAVGLSSNYLRKSHSMATHLTILLSKSVAEKMLLKKI